MTIIIVTYSSKHVFIGGERKTTLVSDIDLTCPCNLKENSCDAGCCCDQVLLFKRDLLYVILHCAGDPDTVIVYFCRKTLKSLQETFLRCSMFKTGFVLNWKCYYSVV